MSNSTALATRENRPLAATGVTISAMQINDMDQAYRLAKAMAQSGMVPKIYNGNPEACFVGILAGAEVGLAPMQSLQSIAVINGNPSLWGDGALALIQASGLLEDIEETDDGEAATCRLVRKDKKTPIVRTFSMADAKKAGLAGKQGPWQQYPSRMRQMRARSWAMRDGFADVLKGLHIAEEVRDHPELAQDRPQTQRLSSQMLAEQAGETIENEATADTSAEEPTANTEAEPVEQTDDVATEAAQTVADIDGPLEQEMEDEDEPEKDEPDPWTAKRDEIVADVDRCKTIIDLQKLRKRVDDDLSAMPDETAAGIKRAFKTMETALKGQGGASHAEGKG